MSLKSCLQNSPTSGDYLGFPAFLERFYEATIATSFASSGGQARCNQQDNVLIQLVRRLVSVRVRGRDA